MLKFIIMGSLFVVGLIIAFTGWLVDKNGCTVILSFEKFHSYWKKDPDGWLLRSGWAHYYKYNDGRHYYDDYNVCFTFIGWIQYRLWKLLCKNSERNEKLSKAQTEFEKLMEDEILEPRNWDEF